MLFFSVCERAEPAAVLLSLPVRPSRRTFDAALAALGDVSLLMATSLEDVSKERTPHIVVPPMFRRGRLVVAVLTKQGRTGHMSVLFTVGYEAADLEDFVGTLTAAGVTLVVDVREFAGSRRKGFAKRALSDRLAEEGLRYMHLRALGDPKPGREAARGGRWTEFLAIYHERIRTSGAQECLELLARQVVSEGVALLCYEADATSCHRSIVAEQVARRVPVRIQHLRVSRGCRGLGQRANRYSDQGCAAPQS